MSDFSTLLRGYVTEQTDRAQAVALDPASESRVVAWRARRRRAARVGVVAGSAAAVVLVAAAGVFASTRPDPVPPAETRTPTVAPTPSESPTEPDAEEPAVDPAAAVNPLLPESQPLEPGALAAAPPGSFVVDYQVGCGYPCLQARSDHVVYLVTPDGGVYDSELPHPSGFLRDWLPGSSVALFARGEGSESEHLVGVDLDTGRTIGELDVAFMSAWLVDAEHVLREAWDLEGAGGMRLERVVLADGEVAASVGLPLSSAVEPSPDRSRVLVTSSSGVRVLDTASFAEVPMPRVEGAFGQPCQGIGWVGSADVVVGCPDPGGTRVLRVPLDGGPVAEVGLHPYGWPYELADVWSIGGRLVLAPLGLGQFGLPESDLAGVPRNLRFVVSRDGGPFRNTFIDWSASSWARDNAVVAVGATADGVIATASAPGSDGQSVVVIDPFDGSARTVLEPAEPGWGMVDGIVVAESSEGGH